MKNRRQRNGIAACAFTILGLLVVLVSSNSAAATIGGRDITEMSIEELAKIEVATASRPEQRRVAVSSIATIRSDGPHFQNVSFSAAYQEYNRPNPDPGIYASPADMGYRAVPPTVAAAIRALGPGF